MNRPTAKMADNSTMESFFHSMKADGVHVITSYSIHYTKLYERSRMEGATSNVDPHVRQVNSGIRGG